MHRVIALAAVLLLAGCKHGEDRARVRPEWLRPYWVAQVEDLQRELAKIGMINKPTRTRVVGIEAARYFNGRPAIVHQGVWMHGYYDWTNDVIYKAISTPREDPDLIGLRHEAGHAFMRYNGRPDTETHPRDMAYCLPNWRD